MWGRIVAIIGAQVSQYGAREKSDLCLTFKKTAKKMNKKNLEENKRGMSVSGPRKKRDATLKPDKLRRV
jgi:hypothetical protein